MANNITYTNISPTDGFVGRLSRYANAEVVYYGANQCIAFTTYKKNPIPISSADKYTIISGGMEYRPDKMSVVAYGFPDLWWKILEANNIKDIYDFKAGLNIRLPASLF